MKLVEIVFILHFIQRAHYQYKHLGQNKTLMFWNGPQIRVGPSVSISVRPARLLKLLLMYWSKTWGGLSLQAVWTKRPDSSQRWKKPRCSASGLKRFVHWQISAHWRVFEVAHLWLIRWSLSGLLLEFPSEGKSPHNRTEEMLKGEISGRRGREHGERRAEGTGSAELRERSGFCAGRHQ